MRLSPLQKKILLLLLGGVVLGLSGSPKKYFKIVSAIAEDWNEINRQSLRNVTVKFYNSKIIDVEKIADDSSKFILTKKGRKLAEECFLEEMSIKAPKQWDSVWRLVVSDIPESRKKSRDLLRYHLKNFGFYQLQKSVYIHPFNCQEEVERLIEIYQLRKYVRFVVAFYIDDEIKIKEFFGLD